MLLRCRPTSYTYTGQTYQLRQLVTVVSTTALFEVLPNIRSLGTPESSADWDPLPVRPCAGEDREGLGNSPRDAGDQASTSGTTRSVAAAQHSFWRWWASFLAGLVHVKCVKLRSTARTCDGRLDGENTHTPHTHNAHTHNAHTHTHTQHFKAQTCSCKTGTATAGGVEPCLRESL